MTVYSPYPHSQYLKTPLPDLVALTAEDPVQQHSVCRQQEALTIHASPNCAAWWLASARFALTFGRFTAAEEATTRAICLALPAGQVEEIVEAWAIQARRHLYQGNYVMARYLTDQIAIFAESGAGTRREALYRELVGQFLLQTGNVPTGEYIEAAAAFRRAIDGYRTCGDALGETRALEGWARTCAGLGQYARTLELVDAGLARCYETGEWRYCGALLACAASALSDAGYREAVAQLFELALDWSDFVGNRISRIQSLYGKGRLYCYEMEQGASHETAWRIAPLQCALKEADAIQARPTSIYCHVTLALIFQKAGERAAQDYHRHMASRLSGMVSGDTSPLRYAQQEPETLLKQSDFACYDAKARGKNRAVLYREIKV